MSQLIELKVPDIGDFKDVEVIEILVKAGETIKPEQSIVTVESDKASMEIPSSAAGIVKEMKVKLGDKISEGSLLLLLETSGNPQVSISPAPPPSPVPPTPIVTPPGIIDHPSSSTQTSTSTTSTGAAIINMGNNGSSIGKPHASPSIRKFAREFGVDLSKITGTGTKQRITHDDVRHYIKAALAQPITHHTPMQSGGGAELGLLPWPQIDFAKLGPIETQPLSRIKKISGANLHRNWVMIPHVTNHDECDITDLETFRVQLNKENEKTGVKLTMLAFMIKAATIALQKFPIFNSSLEGDNLILKKYYHIGFAADTPNGLVVPIVKDADKKGIIEIAQETAELAKKARDGKLSPTEMSGGTFTISSLGGIGGTYFTPIINAPEVAIMGVCKSSLRPSWNGKEFMPRLILPLSLSWDHRVIDGATAARFNVYFGNLLNDFRRAML